MSKPIKIRGTGAYYEDNTFEFTPQKEGNPQRKDVVKTKYSTMYTTTGKQPKRVVTIQYDPDSPDPKAAVQDEVDAIFKKAMPEKKSDKFVPKGRTLLNEDGKVMKYNQNTRRIEISLTIPIALTDGKDYTTIFYEKLQDLSKCLQFNHDFLNQQASLMAQTSTESSAAKQ